MKMLTLWLALTMVCAAQDVTRMDALVRAFTTDDRFMGSVLVARNGERVFEQSYGFANVEWKAQPTPATKYRIGSLTKQFTAAAILILEERGKLSTDDPLDRFIAHVPEAWRTVTLHHLLSHTSGIPNFTGFPEFQELKREPLDMKAVLSRLKALPLEFAPGERHAYSNSGYLILGHILEKVSGQTYAAFLESAVFQRLGMNDSGYDVSAAVLPERASGYVRSSQGLLNAPYINMQVPHAAGGLYSTPSDLLRWTEGLFGGRILSPESLRKMTTPVKNDYAYGLAVSINEGRRSFAHAGGIDGFNTHLIYFPDEKLMVAVLANVNTDAADILARHLATLAVGGTVTLPGERREIGVPEETLRRYAGVYELGPGITNTIRVAGGRLTTQLSGQAALPLFAESPTKFFLKVVDAQVEFVEGADGAVTHLLQHQNGRTLKAERISDG